MAQVTIENNVKLERLLTSNPEMEKNVQKIVRQVLIGAQNGVQQKAMQLSTKQAYMAVRKAVYKKVLGGNLNIISGGKSAGKRAPLPPVYHKLEHATNKKGNHRGGNRMPRSQRTIDLLTYAGPDRGFILRFLNSGTPERDTNGTRRVGKIMARNWFGPAATQELNRIADEFDKLLDVLIQQEFNG